MLAQTLFEGSRGHVRAAGFQFGQGVDAVAEEGGGANAEWPRIKYETSSPHPL